jgi:hypothetical protein
MQMNQKKNASSKFPLRLMPSVRKGVEAFSQREGVSLNQFINVALAEKLAHLQHDEWLARRPLPTAALIARALEVLDRPAQNLPVVGDELPDRYVSIRNTSEYQQATDAK